MGKCSVWKDERSRLEKILIISEKEANFQEGKYWISLYFEPISGGHFWGLLQILGEARKKRKRSA